MWRTWLRGPAGAVVGVALVLCGCSSSKESASRDQLTAQVGVYSPPPPAAGDRLRVGVPPFNVSTPEGSAPDLNDLAADQMTTLLDQTGRFDMIERTQLQKLINEQNLEGVVAPGELAKPGLVRGVDYLLLGKVTNLRVKQESTSNGFGLAQLGGAINLGGMDVKNNKTIVTTECGVDIRLVNPTTGELMVSNFSEFKRTDSAGSMGLAILGANANSSADVQLSDDDKGKVLRLALDDAVRKSLPRIDAFVAAHPSRPAAAVEAAPAAPAMAAPAAAAPADAAPNLAVPAGTSTPAPTTAVAAKKFCPNCGAEVSADAKFCPKCGAKLN